MTHINVIDLDNTLLPYDTLHKYILLKIKKGDLNLMAFTLLRILRILNRSKYSEILFKSVNNCDKLFLNHFIKEQCDNIDLSVMNIVKSHCHSTQNIVNVICSASPSNYVKPIAEMLGFIGIGSEYVNGKYVHMYGNQKKNTILQRFPQSEYFYNFAISDSMSDLDLILCFNEHILYSRK